MDRRVLLNRLNVFVEASKNHFTVAEIAEILHEKADQLMSGQGEEEGAETTESIEHDETTELLTPPSAEHP